jgi:capsular polysaccharide transport system permease protein
MAVSGPLGGVLGDHTEEGWRPKPWLVRYRWFGLAVVLPTVLTALYLYLLSANQYVSETQFMIRDAQAPAVASSLGAVLGAANLQPSSEETRGVQTYLISHDAVADLRRSMDLKQMFSRPLLDVFGRYNGSGAPESLLKFYRRQVEVKRDSSSSVTTLSVRAFTPADSKRIADALLVQSEALIDRFNERAQADALRIARAEVQRAEGRVTAVHAQLASLRQREHSLDPEKSSVMVTTVIGGIESELAKARADLAVQSAFLKAGNPRLVALQSRVADLERQASAQSGRLAGGPESIAPALTAFERVSLEREFADKEFAAAMASLEAARVDAQKKHLYLVRVVEPNVPVKSLYPQRALTVATVFASLLVAYGIVWLILAGIREHAA